MEKRKHPRVDCTFRVTFQTFQNKKINYNQTHSKNISTGGILLHADEEGKLGSDIVIKFMIPQMGDKIMARGKIVRVRKLDAGTFEIGVQFLNIRELDMDQVKKFVQIKVKG